MIPDFKVGGGGREIPSFHVPAEKMGLHELFWLGLPLHLAVGVNTNNTARFCFIWMGRGGIGSGDGCTVTCQNGHCIKLIREKVAV